MALIRKITNNSLLISRHRFSLSNKISQNFRHPLLSNGNRLLSVEASLPITKTLDLHHNENEIQIRLPSYLEMCPAIKKEEVQILHEVLEQILEDLENVPFVKDATLANQRMKTFARYTLLAAMSSHGTIVLEVDRFYAEKRKANNKLLCNEEEHFRLVSVLFWAMNMYAQNLNIQDDIIDGNESRNNVKCWHMLDGIGLHAIRDSQLLKDAIFVLLNKYFRNQEYYISLVDLMNVCMYSTYIGFSEMEIIRPSTNPFNVNYKDCLNTLRDVSMSTAIIAGITEDYIDCYGDAKVNERKPTDIQEGKQTWLYWKALELGSPDQAQQLLNSYGKKDKTCVETVKSIYKILGIQEYVLQTLKTMEKDVETQLLELNHTNIPWVVFPNIINYYRGVRKGLFGRP